MHLPDKEPTPLRAANGTKIRTKGKVTRKVKLDNGVEYVHDFWVAAVTKPILGADFFSSNNLAIDLRKDLSLIHI